MKRTVVQKEKRKESFLGKLIALSIHLCKVPKREQKVENEDDFFPTETNKNILPFVIFVVLNLSFIFSIFGVVTL